MLANPLGPCVARNMWGTLACIFKPSVARLPIYMWGKLAHIFKPSMARLPIFQNRVWHACQDIPEHTS